MSNQPHQIPAISQAWRESTKSRVEKMYENQTPVVVELDSTAPLVENTATICDHVRSKCTNCVHGAAAIGYFINNNISCCFGSIYSQTSATVYLHRLAGTLSAVALAFVARCWLMHSTQPLDVITIILSTFAMVLLNTGSAFSLTNSTQQKQIRLVIGLCYLCMFMQWARASWPGDDAGKKICVERCCRWVELGYGITVFVASTVMFFAEYTFSAIWVSYAPPPSSVATTIAASLSVVAMFLLVAGITFLAIAVTEEKMAFLTIVPYMFGLVACFFVYRPASDDHPELRMWGRFCPAWTYTVAVLWPLVLWNTHNLRTDVAAFALASGVCVIASGRMLVHSMDTHIGSHQSLSFIT